jgi:hypothetical protein
MKKLCFLFIFLLKVNMLFADSNRICVYKDWQKLFNNTFFDNPFFEVQNYDIIPCIFVVPYDNQTVGSRHSFQVTDKFENGEFYARMLLIDHNGEYKMKDIKNFIYVKNNMNNDLINQKNKSLKVGDILENNALVITNIGIVDEKTRLIGDIIQEKIFIMVDIKE